MWCLCRNEDYFIKNLNTGAEIYIDYYGVGIDETYPTYSIVYENCKGKTNLKTFDAEGCILDSDLKIMFRAIMMDIFNSLKKGECIDLTEDL